MSFSMCSFRRSSDWLHCALAGLLFLAFGGCLGPLVGDETQEKPDSGLLPADAQVPSAYDDATLAKQIDANDGVDRFVPLLSGFANGVSVQYWTFGEAPAAIAPVWIVGKATAAGFERLGEHPVLFDVVPGDVGYTPWWQVFQVVVTKKYKGEKLTTLQAIQEAVSRGLVRPPVAKPIYVNCPVVHGDVLLDMGPQSKPLAPSIAYYKGWEVAYFNLEPALEVDKDLIAYPVADVYVLRREGSEPLSEPMRGVDMTADADAFDSNNIFAVGLEDETYTPLWRVVEVVVPADYKSIDSYEDDAVADFRDAVDLFREKGGKREPRVGNVVAFAVTETLVNCPIRQQSP